MTDPSVSGRLRDGVHTLRIRVYYEDTDFSGIVYHASYLRFCERGRTEYLRALGIDQGALYALPEAERRSFAVRSMTCEFLKPARIDDLLTVDTRIAEARRASLTMDQIIRCGETVVFTARVRVACLNDKARPAALPSALKHGVNAA